MLAAYETEDDVPGWSRGACHGTADAIQQDAAGHVNDLPGKSFGIDTYCEICQSACVGHGSTVP